MESIVQIFIVLVVIGVLYNLVKYAYRGLTYDQKNSSKTKFKNVKASGDVVGRDKKKKSDNDWWDDVDEMFENLDSDGEG